MDIISDLKWTLIKRENQKSIIVGREYESYPPGAVITTDEGTLGTFYAFRFILIGLTRKFTLRLVICFPVRNFFTVFREMCSVRFQKMDF